MFPINSNPTQTPLSYGLPGSYAIGEVGPTGAYNPTDQPVGQTSANLSFVERLNSALSGMMNGGMVNSNPVAAGTPAMLEEAASYEGLSERKDRKQIMEITGESGIDPSKSKWCAAFAMNLMQDHKVLDTTGLENINYTPEIKKWAEEKGIYKKPDDYTPKPGDAIMFDWEENGKKVDHIGLVKEVKDGQVTTIEGNKDNKVGERTISLDSKMIDGYVVSADVKAAPASPVDPKEANASHAAAAKSAVSAKDPKSSNAASAAAHATPEKSTASAHDPKSSNAASAASHSSTSAGHTSSGSSGAGKSSGSTGNSSSGGGPR